MLSCGFCDVLKPVRFSSHGHKIEVERSLRICGLHNADSRSEEHSEMESFVLSSEARKGRGETNLCITGNDT